jgi:hypothetical protein
MFVGWGTPVRGREAQASRVFSEFVELLGGWQSKGTIKSFTPVFIAASGGHLQGFFLVTGDVAKLAMVQGSEEMRRAVTRAQLIVDNVIVQMALTGDEVGKQMAVFNANAAELSK